MAEVRLDKEWTDPAGVTHAAGDTVDVDEQTLAELREAGIVGDVDRRLGRPDVRRRRHRRRRTPAAADDPDAPAADINDTDLG